MFCCIVEIKCVLNLIRIGCAGLSYFFNYSWLGGSLAEAIMLGSTVSTVRAASFNWFMVHILAYRKNVDIVCQIL